MNCLKAVLFSLALFSCCTSASTDCALKRVAFEFAQSLFKRLPQDNTLVHTWSKQVFDGLTLKNECGDTPPPLQKPRKHHPRGEHVRDGATDDYYVDTKGDDSADGSLESPFRTITRAISASRKSNLATTIFLRKGTYFEGKEIVLDAQDSGLTITSFQGEFAWLSGGIKVAADSPWKPDAKKKVWSTVISNPNVTEVAGLFTLEPHQRLTRARYPNFDSETDAWGFPGWGLLGPCEIIDQPCCNGSSDGTRSFALSGDAGQFANPDVIEWWRAPKQTPPAQQFVNLTDPTSSGLPLKNDSTMQQYNYYGTGSGSICELWDGPSYWCSKIA
jgi:hypothetical protein